MSGIEALYINALLADASYVSLPQGKANPSQDSEITQRMTQTLSRYIAGIGFYATRVTGRFQLWRRMNYQREFHCKGGIQ